MLAVWTFRGNKSQTKDSHIDTSCIVPELTQDAITNNVCKLSKLRHLDISRFSVHGNNLGEYKNPNQVLRSIAENLPHLVSLDISGTNLAGTGTYESQQQSGGVVEASSDASWPHSAEAQSDSREGSSQSTANSKELPKCDIPGRGYPWWHLSYFLLHKFFYNPAVVFGGKTWVNSGLRCYGPL